MCNMREMVDKELRIEAMVYAYNKVYGIPEWLARKYQEYVFKFSEVVGTEEEESVRREYEDIVNRFNEMLVKAKSEVENHTTKFQRAYSRKYYQLRKDYFKKYNKRYFDDRRKRGLCLRCGQPVDDPRFVRCSRCRRPVSDWSLLMKWVNDIGKTGEWVAKQVVKTLPNVVENYVLPNNKRIEFYWPDEGVGIDITVTHTKYASHFYWAQLRKKVEKYSDYLDELHVVVIEDKFSRQDYIKLNERVPKNTFVYRFTDLPVMLPVDVNMLSNMVCGFKYLVDTNSDEVRVLRVD